MNPKTLRAWRTQRKLTQDELHDACTRTRAAARLKKKPTQTSISNIEIGRVVDPKWSTVEILSEALKCDPRAIKFGVKPDAESARG